MLRNRALRRLIVAMLTLTAVGSAAGFWMDWRAGCLALLLGLALLLCASGFAHLQYRRIRRLSNCLERICAGDFSLDVRENDEGELSILQNDIHKVTRILNEQNQQLSQEKTWLADSISDISHQLKTPLTSMMMMADLLQSPDLPPEKRREFSRSLHAQLDRLEWLVASLLKLARLDAGAVLFHPEEHEAREVLEKACAPLSIPAELRGLTLVLDAPEGLRISCDFNWTAEALLNVVKNCVEHTPEGGTVTVSARRNPLYTLFTVTDTGEGIVREDQPHLFERFYRGKNASPDSAGIGLAMARSILRAQGGDISVKSAPGQGATFSLKIMSKINE